MHPYEFSDRFLDAEVSTPFCGISERSLRQQLTGQLGVIGGGIAWSSPRGPCARHRDSEKQKANVVRKGKSRKNRKRLKTTLADYNYT
jgi:hypothetical protein